MDKIKIPRKIKPSKNYVINLLKNKPFSWCIEILSPEIVSNEKCLDIIYYSKDIKVDDEYFLDYFKNWLHKRETCGFFGVEEEMDILKKILKC